MASLLQSNETPESGWCWRSYLDLAHGKLSGSFACDTNRSGPLLTAGCAALAPYSCAWRKKVNPHAASFLAVSTFARELQLVWRVVWGWALWRCLVPLGRGSGCGKGVSFGTSGPIGGRLANLENVSKPKGLSESIKRRGRLLQGDKLPLRWFKISWERWEQYQVSPTP